MPTRSGPNSGQLSNQEHGCFTGMGGSGQLTASNDESRAINVTSSRAGQPERAASIQLDLSKTGSIQSFT